MSLPFVVSPPACNPQVKVRQPFAPPTGYIVVEGSGYPHDSPATRLIVDVAIRCFGKKIRVKPDLRGRWSARIQIPAEAPPGEHQVVVWMSVTRLGFSFYFQDKTSVTVFTDWAQSGFDACGSRYNPYENVLSADNVHLLNVVVGSQGWEYSAPGFSMLSDPVVGRGYVFIGLDGRGPDEESVYAFNAFQGGQPVWQEKKLGSARTPAFVGGNVIVGTSLPYLATSPSLWAYSSEGLLLWSMQSSQPGVSPPVVAPPLVAGGAVYAIVRPDDPNPSGLIKVDAKTGSPSPYWPSDSVTPLGGSLNWCTPVFSDGKVFVVDSSQLYKINAVDGTIEAQTLPLGTIENDVYASPVVAGGVVFLGTSDNGFFAYNTADDMSWKWQWAGPSAGNIPAIQCSPAVTKDRVYFTTYDKDTDETALYALAVEDGVEKWKVPVQSGRARCWPPAVANGVVYLVTDDTLYAYDAAKGLRHGNPLLVWQYVYQGSAMSFTGPPVVANGFVYVTMDISGSVLVALSLPPRP